MDGYLRWYVALEPFYKILIIGSLLFGTLGVVFGVGTRNLPVFAFGLLWLLGGPAFVRVVTRFEE